MKRGETRMRIQKFAQASIGIALFTNLSVAAYAFEAVFREDPQKLNYMFIAPEGVGASNQQSWVNYAGVLSESIIQRLPELFQPESAQCQFRVKLERSQSSTVHPSRPNTLYRIAEGFQIAPDSQGGLSISVQFSVPEYRGDDVKVRWSVYRHPPKNGKYKYGQTVMHVVVPVTMRGDFAKLRHQDPSIRIPASQAFVRERLGDQFQVEMKCDQSGPVN